MKNKIINIVICVLLLCDMALFAVITLLALLRGGHIYTSDSCETAASSDGKTVLDIYDETFYINHEPDTHDYTVDKNGKTYMSFSAEKYYTDEKDEFVILEYEHNHRLKFHVF